jgi:hypothetical protein
MNRLEIAVVLGGAVWTFFKTTSFLFLRRTSQSERIFQALEVGVSEAWELVIKPWLEKNGKDATLTPNIRRAAEEHAIEVAGEVDGIVKRTRMSVLRATLKAAVEEAKRRGGK